MTKTIPPPIYSTEPGTWAYSTVTQRLPEIAGRVIEENQFPDQINQNISRLQEEINQREIRFLLDQDSPDQEAWEEYIQPYQGQSWLEVPWFFAEHYFYRRIMEAVKYFQVGQDPFWYQKEQGLVKARNEILALGKFLQARLEQEGNIKETLQEGLYFALGGNQADLSLWPAGSQTNPRHASRTSLREHLLADHSSQLLELLGDGSQALDRVDLLLDNAGFELISDLALADLLLSLGLVKQVHLRAKAHPTFVSDVIPGDVDEAIGFLLSQEEAEASSFGRRLEGFLQSGKLVVRSHFFWNSPLAMWELGNDIREDLVNSSLLVSKGDANYRRLLGDRQWDFTTPFAEVVDYLPVPLAALRTLKAELAAGLEPEKITAAEREDPTWMVDGRWGVIHFADKGR